MRTLRILGPLTAAFILSAGCDAMAQTVDSGNSPRNPASEGAGSSTTGESRSVSETSTSGGRDANGNQGRDAMPDSSIGVRPQKDQPKRPYEGSTSGK